MTEAQDRPNVETQFYTFADDKPMKLACGGTLSPVTLAYETHGKLNEDGSNAILVFHAFSGSHHVAGFTDTVPGSEELWNEECQVGWWDAFVGPGRPFDTDRYFIICANWLGSCYGSTSAYAFNPETDKPYGSDFPIITASDIVDAQLALIDHLGIEQLLAVVGGSLGGFMCLDLAVRHPDRVRGVIPIASSAGCSTLQKMYNFEQIFAIEEDCHFHRGDYYEQGEHPDMGLMLARMIAHKSYVSLSVIEERASAEIIQDKDDLKGYKLQHRVESYVLHQAKKFIQRFDANAYLSILNMWQRFNIARQFGGDLSAALSRCRNHRFLVFTIDSDVCFYPDEQRELCDGLRRASVPYQHVTIHSDKGHDSFLLEPELYAPNIIYLLNQVSKL